jgi:predicted nuclease with TOPRIM domain
VPVTPPPPTKTDVDVVEEAVEEAIEHDGLRTVRRWMIVLSIWALAATAIAVIAFMEARDAKSEQDSSQAATRADIERVQQRLRDDVDELRTDVDRLPTQAEYSQLQTRLRKAQRDATTARDDATAASDDAAELKPKVEALERQVNSLESTADNGGAGN